MALVTPLNASARCADASRAVGVRLRATTRRSIQGLRKPLAPPAAVRVDAVDGTIDQNRQALPCPNIGHRLSPRQSPFAANNNFGGGFVSDNDRVALHAIYIDSAEETDFDSPMPEGMQELKTAQWALRAGARETIYFNPPEVRAAIVTCGGLCPGLNDVVAGLVVKLEQYGVTNIQGIMQGLKGFYSKDYQPVKLNGRVVDGIQMEGGTILGTSRGGADMKRIVQRIDMWGLDMVFVVGGNGGNAAANAIHNECERLQVNCCVIGIPKSIDNDILLIDHTFGFETAVAEAQHAIKAAKVEASSARKGVGLVKLMGRSSGFIALQASMASGIVDVTLIPEVPFVLEGPNGLLAYVASIIDRKGHCVICVAEGAGQDLVQGAAKGETDASGNPILGDIGHYLRRAIKNAVPDCDMKYIDPTYMIRAIPANPSDQIYCKILAHNAVHAAFCGYTGVTVGLVNTHYCYLPIPALICAARTVDPKGKMWRRLIASTLQPEFHRSEE